jgi:hypothetical protein
MLCDHGVAARSISVVALDLHYRQADQPTRNTPMTQPRPLLPLLLLVAACGEGSIEEGQVQLVTDMVPVPEAVLRASGRGMRPFASGVPTVLYVNYDGATISKSYSSDASKNVSFIGGGTVPAFSGDRTAVTNLVKQLYAAYNIQIVTERPTSGDYDMALVGGTPAHLGLSYPQGVVGVAPMDCGHKMPRDIAFIFAQSLQQIVGSGAIFPQRVAETVAHESAHTYGLPHSGDGCDLMSYSSCSKLKTFLDKTMSMQSDSYGQCGMTSMNSHQLVLTALGVAGTGTQPPPTGTTDTAPPQVAISSPAAGATVGTTVTVKATISDDKGVAKGEILVDGTLKTSRTAAPYDFALTLTAGTHTLTVNGYDTTGNKGTATVSVTVDAGQPPAPDPSDTEAPKVTITSPANGATVPGTITVRTTVTDNKGVAKVELALDGQIIASRTAAPFDFDAVLPAGQHTLAVTGHDATGNKASASVTVTVEGTQASPPVPMPNPDAEPAPGTFGATCQSSSDCTSGLCAEDPASKERYCTQACDPAGGVCPNGASCYPTNTEQNVCGAPAQNSLQPAGERLLGSCAVGGSASAGADLLGVLLLLGLAWLRGRRAR